MGLPRFCRKPECGHAAQFHREGKCHWAGCACTDSAGSLTEREIQVVRLIATGRTVKEMGIDLGIATKTAEAHKYNLMRKLGAHNAVQVAIAAFKKGLITLDECPETK
jgi:DNA-binding NarL/FixJ family response regulator